MSLNSYKRKLIDTPIPQEWTTARDAIQKALRQADTETSKIKGETDVYNNLSEIITTDGVEPQETTINVLGTKKGASAPTEALRDIGASGGVKESIFQFSKTTQNDVYFAFHSPIVGLDENYAIDFRVMWIPGDAWTSGNFMWKLEYLLKKEDAIFGDADTSTGTPTTISMDVTPDNAVDYIETQFEDTITLKEEDVLICHFYRDVANDNGDDHGDVRFFEIKYHHPDNYEPIYDDDGDVITTV
jgi:hypothetical protein